jgi:hypothetical protein
MDELLRNLVRARAGNRCEYCQSHQDDEPYFRYHLEHVVARQHGGLSVESNLALACHHCNLHKGPNLTGIDPETRKIVPLFHPRTQTWAEHFERRGVALVGRTPTGRATVRVLAMNARSRLQLRSVATRPL